MLVLAMGTVACSDEGGVDEESKIQPMENISLSRAEEESLEQSAEFGLNLFNKATVNLPRFTAENTVIADRLLQAAGIDIESCNLPAIIGSVANKTHIQHKNCIEVNEEGAKMA